VYKVLTIAGTDPSGGAGIQADLKSFTAFKTYGMSVITAVVAQNTCGVSAIQNIDPEIVEAQLDAVFTDIFPDAVKIGMVSSLTTIEVIVKKLKEYQPKNIVLDPVMVSTSRHRLLQKEAEEALIKRLIPLANIITPNIPEAEVLCGFPIETKDDMLLAAKQIANHYHGHILLTGGHLKDACDDLLYHPNEIHWLPGKRIDTNHTHGTGCTLSAAIAAGLAKGNTISVAVETAKNYVTGALSQGLNLGKGNGPIDHCYSISSF